MNPSHLSAAELQDIASRYPDARAEAERQVTATCEQAIELLKPSVVPVFKVEKLGRVAFEGSGVLLSRGNARYLFSAAHVFDHCQRRPVLLDGGLGGAVLTNEPYVTNPPEGGSRDDDTFDIGAVLLTDAEAASLGESRFHELPQGDVPPADRDFTVLVLIGFPAALQEYDTSAGRHVMQQTSTRLGYAEPRAYELTGLHPDTHLLVGYRERNIVESGHRGSPTHLRGNSGGGVWRLEFAPTGGLLVPPRFEGIFVERPESFRPSLMVTTPYVMNSFLDMNELW
jgi:hypothetical protein